MWEYIVIFFNCFYVLLFCCFQEKIKINIYFLMNV